MPASPMPFTTKGGGHPNEEVFHDHNGSPVNAENIRRGEHTVTPEVGIKKFSLIIEDETLIKLHR